MPGDVRDDLMGTGQPFSVPPGQALPRDMLDGSFVFIVTGGIASKFQRGESGRLSEVGMVGREGMFPLCALLNVPAAPHTVISQVGDLVGQRVRTVDFQRIIQPEGPARQLVRRYIYSFVTQIASNIAASDQHQLEARIARWLLMCHDRVDGDTISLTHETLAQMAFVHRPTITQKLQEMREKGWIANSRGEITIVDRAPLRALAGDAYAHTRSYLEKAIGPIGKPDSPAHRAA